MINKFIKKYTYFYKMIIINNNYKLIYLLL